MSCEYCKQKWWVNPNDFTAIHPNFCIKCGESLTLPEPLTQLEMIDLPANEPFWGVGIGECEGNPGWCYMNDEGDTFCVGGSYAGSIDDYGKTWLAYARRIGEEQP